MTGLECDISESNISNRTTVHGGSFGSSVTRNLLHQWLEVPEAGALLWAPGENNMQVRKQADCTENSLGAA